MLDLSIYHAMFSDLSFDELTTIIVSEMRRRLCTGAIYIVEENEHHAHFASCHDRNEIPLSPAKQLAKFALHANELSVADAEFSYDPDDNITSDKEPWRQ